MQAIAIVGLSSAKEPMAADKEAVELGTLLAELGPEATLVSDGDHDHSQLIHAAKIWLPGDPPTFESGVVAVAIGIRNWDDMFALLDCGSSAVILCGPTPAGSPPKEFASGRTVLATVPSNAGDVVAALARATQTAEEAVSRRLGSLQRSLSLALADPAPVPALLARLKRVCNATVALIDRHGEVLHATGPVPRSLLFEKISSTKAETQPLSIDGWHGLAARISDPEASDQHAGWLVVTSRRPDFPDAYATSAVHVAASLVETSQRMSVVARRQERAVRAAVLEQALALRSERHDAELAARVAGLGIDFSGEVRLVLASFAGPLRNDQRQQAADELLDLLSAICETAGHPALLSARSGGVTMLLQCSVAGIQRMFAAHQDALPSLLIGIGRPIGVVDAAVDSFHDAQLAVRTLRRVVSQQRLMSYEDFDFATRLFADVGLDRMVSWAEDFLKPLVARDNLVAGLRAYFEHDQNINLAADALNIHHNSLRYRLGKVEELLTINLKQPAAISSVFLALTALDLTRQHAGAAIRPSRPQDGPALEDVSASGAVTQFQAGGRGDLGVALGAER